MVVRPPVGLAGSGIRAGALSGAAFALIETFGVSAQSADWAALLTSRMATGLLHVTTSGLMGWGITIAWKERKYLMLLLTYIGAVFMHGAWNADVILFSISSLVREANPADPFGALVPITLGLAVFLAILMLLILLVANRNLARQKFSEAPTSPESIPA